MNYEVDFSKKVVQEHQFLLTVSYMFFRQRLKFVSCYDYEKSIIFYYSQKKQLSNHRFFKHLQIQRYHLIFF